MIGLSLHVMVGGGPMFGAHFSRDHVPNGPSRFNLYLTAFWASVGANLMFGQAPA